MTDNQSTLPPGWTAEQRAAIQQETQRILESPAFKSSNRCVTLFRVLIDHALDSSSTTIKERTLGIEVFERPTNYDTGTDPIVRRTANEIRKRLAQCYLKPACQLTVKIHLLPGSYLPEFEFLAPDAPATNLLALSPSPAARSSFPWTRALLALAALLLIVAATFFAVGYRRTHAAEYQLWKPFFESGQRVMICISDMPIQSNGLPVKLPEVAHRSPAPTQTEAGSGKLDRFGDSRFTDVNIAHILTSRLAEFHTPTSLRPASELTFSDFNSQPLILIGSYNNPWSQPLLNGLRFQAHYDTATGDRWIDDTLNPTSRTWSLPASSNSVQTYDYAILSRFLNPQTKQWIVSLAGLGFQGTQAAGELLTDSNLARQIPTSLRTAGNFQLVIKVDLVQGSIGTPQIIASHTW